MDVIFANTELLKLITKTTLIKHIPIHNEGIVKIKNINVSYTVCDMYDIWIDFAANEGMTFVFDRIGVNK